LEQLFDRKRECDTRGVLSCEGSHVAGIIFLSNSLIEKESATQEACSPVNGSHVAGIIFLTIL
jgi:hypothetical protein